MSNPVTQILIKDTVSAKAVPMTGSADGKANSRIAYPNYSTIRALNGVGVSAGALTVLYPFTDLSAYEQIMLVGDNLDGASSITFRFQRSLNGVRPDMNGTTDLVVPINQMAILEIGPNKLVPYWRISALVGAGNATADFGVFGVPRT